MTDISDLLERVKAATGPDWRLDVAIECAIPDVGCGERNHRPSAAQGKVVCNYPSGSAGTYNPPRFTYSIESVIYRMSRLLPGWRYDLHSPRMGQAWEAVLMDGDSASRRIVVGHAATAPLAILAALLQALTKERTNVQ